MEISNSHATRPLDIVQTIQQRLSDAQNEPHGLWERVAQAKIVLLEEHSEVLNEQLDELLVVLGKIVADDTLIDPSIATQFVTVLVGFAGNVQIGAAFIGAIDQIITMHTRTGRPLTALYLARGRCLGLLHAERPEHEEALRLAYAHATCDDEVLDVLHALAWYQLETSCYAQSIQTSQDSLDLIAQKPQLDSQRARFLTTLGMASFLQFKYEDSQNAFQQACAAAELAQDHASWATALHYLGRIALEGGDPMHAMQFYVVAQEHQEKIPYEPVATAFYHLRMAQILIAARLLPEARDHLNTAQELFALVRDDAIGQIQVELAASTLYQIEGSYGEARKRIEIALQMAQSKGFYRGELLCLVDLFWLHLRRYAPLHAIIVFLRAMLTWRKGELGKNDGLTLLATYLKRVLLIPIRMVVRCVRPHHDSKKPPQTLLSCCCPMHTSVPQQEQRSHEDALPQEHRS